MNRLKLEQYIKECYPEQEIVLADGFEKQFLGIGHQHNKRFAVYNKKGCILQLVTNHQMCFEEAEEYFLYNVQDAYVGKSTPVFLDIIK